MVAERYPLLFGSFPNYYDLLGLTGTASKKDVQLAYKTVALREHPDKAGSTAPQNELFSAVNNAKDVLIDEDKRKHYDRELRLRGTPTALRSHSASTAQQRSSDEPFANTRSAFNGSTKGTGFAFNHTSRPFGSTSSFGPGRSASQRHNAESKESSRKAYNSDAFGFNSSTSQKSYDTGCAICGYPFCTGSCFRSHPNRDDVPCSNRDSPPPLSQANSRRDGDSHAESSERPGTARKWSFFMPQTSNFARENGTSSGVKSQCDNDPICCPVHKSRNYRESTYWHGLLAEGDPDYIDPDRCRAFNEFTPPASAYDRHQHNGTKPDSLMWRQARWKCFTLSEEHQNAVDVTFQACEAAVKVEQINQTLNSNARARMAGEPYHRLTAVLDLITEVVHFAAASYRYYAIVIDGAIYKRPDIAIPMLIEAREDLEALLKILNPTNTFLECLNEQLAISCIELSADTLGRGARTVMVAWDRIVIFPDNITHGAQDIFFSRRGRFENCFERRSSTDGYARKPFLLKAQTQRGLAKHQQRPWTPEDEQPTLQKWEVGQRTREAQMEHDAWERKLTEEQMAGFWWRNLRGGTGATGGITTNWAGPECEMTG